MATGLSTAAASECLTALTTGTGNFVYIQLHDGDPGSAGTANVADETTRQSMTWTGSNATRTNSGDVTWDDVTVASGTQTYTHFTAWDAATSGNFGFSGTITANSVSDGDSFTIPAGDMTISLTVAS